ncbi:MAG: hypothetical protein NTW04_04610, partial [Elusimicrobia bacterium]|nr:hypothetical protein [Elusimicrobiota bacterium]
LFSRKYSDVAFVCNLYTSLPSGANYDTLYPSGSLSTPGHLVVSYTPIFRSDKESKIFYQYLKECSNNMEAVFGENGFIDTWQYLQSRFPQLSYHELGEVSSFAANNDVKLVEQIIHRDSSRVSQEFIQKFRLRVAAEKGGTQLGFLGTDRFNKLFSKSAPEAGETGILILKDGKYQFVKSLKGLEGAQALGSYTVENGKIVWKEGLGGAETLTKVPGPVARAFGNTIGKMLAKIKPYEGVLGAGMWLWMAWDIAMMTNPTAGDSYDDMVNKRQDFLKDHVRALATMREVNELIKKEPGLRNVIGSDLASIPNTSLGLIDLAQSYQDAQKIIGMYKGGYHIKMTEKFCLGLPAPKALAIIQERPEFVFDTFFPVMQMVGQWKANYAIAYDYTMKVFIGDLDEQFKKLTNYGRVLNPFEPVLSVGDIRKKLKQNPPSKFNLDMNQAVWYAQSHYKPEHELAAKGVAANAIPGGNNKSRSEQGSQTYLVAGPPSDE